MCILQCSSTKLPLQNSCNARRKINNWILNKHRALVNKPRTRITKKKYLNNYGKCCWIDSNWSITAACWYLRTIPQTEPCGRQIQLFDLRYWEDSLDCCFSKESSGSFSRSFRNSHLISCDSQIDDVTLTSDSRITSFPETEWSTSFA